MNIKFHTFAIRIFIKFLNFALEILYAFMKVFPTQDGKIVFCSRQSNEPPLDFLIIKDYIKANANNTKFVMICSRLDNSVKGYMSFFVQMIRSMYHLATSNICILDSYWPAASMLKHKKNLKVIQIWHSIGKMKKSGYQSLGKKSGRNKSFAVSLKMHRNYDYFIGGAPIWNKYYEEAFNIRKEQILNYGLPRIDYLIETQKSNREKFFKEYPSLEGKKIVLYAPTFRKNMKSHWDNILNAKNYDDIVIIIKNHPGQVVSKRTTKKNIFYPDDWKTIDLLAVCDYMITDYSSIALEAAVLKKRTFFWTYDYDEYIENSGINIDLKKEMSDNLSADINDIMYRIENDIFNSMQQKQFIEKYLPTKMGESTEKISNFVMDLMTGHQERENEIHNYGGRPGEQVEPLYGSIQALNIDQWRTADMSDDTVTAGDVAGKFGNNRNIS